MAKAPPPPSSNSSNNNNNRQIDLKRILWVALSAVVLVTTIDLFTSTMLTPESFFQADGSRGALFSGDNSAGRQDWHTELLALTAASTTTCPPGHVLWQGSDNHHANRNTTTTPYKLNRHQIPPLVHIRAASPCLSAQRQQQVQAWQQVLAAHKKQNYQIVIHDDTAQDRLLLDRYWKSFPHLQHTAIPCATSATQRNVWKALVLYQYGGIVLDLEFLQSPDEEAPSLKMEESFLNSLEAPEASAILLLDHKQRLSNALLAGPPRHSFFYLWAHDLLYGTLGHRNVEGEWAGLAMEWTQGYGPQERPPTAPSLRTTLLHFLKQIHQVPNISAYQVQPILYTQPAAHDATVRVVEATQLASWFGTAFFPLREELRWGNTDTCLMRIYRVLESPLTQKSKAKNEAKS
eukprot:scaffold307_cov162-Amphora_coffeaeformis.AAC.8